MDFHHLVTWITLSPTRFLGMEHFTENGLLVCSPITNQYSHNLLISNQWNIDSLQVSTLVLIVSKPTALINRRSVANIKLVATRKSIQIRHKSEGPYPHLSQREAKSPDRIGQPFFHSPDVEAAPHSAFMQTFIDSIIDQLSGSIQLSITSNEGRALSYSPHDGALSHRKLPL